MQWLAKYTKPQPKDGEVRLFRKFAWLPHYIDGTFVWLEKYETLQVYRQREENIVLNGKQDKLLAGIWISFADRCK